MLGRLACVVAGLLVAPAAARAFTIEGPTPVAHGCHERISTVAVERIPFPADVPQPPADHAFDGLVASVPFGVPDAARRDPRLLALLIGVRSPDTDDLALTDLDRLGTLHGDPARQMEHCLRGQLDDGAAGDVTALAACRAHILAELDTALGTGDTIDGGTIDVRTSLAFEGTRTVTLPRYPYHLGRALHALQDSFTHSYRDDDGHHVLTVHNWVDWVLQGYDPARDGVRHNSDRDHCDGDADVLARVAHAQQASEELLAALADATGGRAGRLARVAAVLDAWLGLTPGCDATNAWCGAEDAAHPDSSCDVAAPGASSRGGLAALAALVLVAALAVARRRGSVVPAVLIAALAVVAPHASRAQDAAATQDAAPHAAPPALRPPAALRPWAASITAAVSPESPAFAFSLGGRWSPTDDWRFGLDVEWSPWFSLSALRGAPGALDVYASAQFDWIRERDTVRIGTRGALGISVLLFDQSGASAGDVGPYLALTPIGVGWHFAPDWEFRFDPEGSVAIPHITGVPLVFREYRFAVSFVWRP